MPDLTPTDGAESSASRSVLICSTFSYERSKSRLPTEVHCPRRATCRPLASRRGLLEVRSSLTQNRIARVRFCIHQGQMVLLHGFIKKTQQTPENDLDLAVKRQKEVEGGKAAK